MPSKRPNVDIWDSNRFSVYRLFHDTWVAWGRGWAIQFNPGMHISVGVHFDMKRMLGDNPTEKRPLLDLHLGWVTVALGPDAHITGQDERQRHSCRGFMFADNPHL